MPMHTYIALFRGINVGGNNLLPMKALKQLLEQNACADVQTYIQSGNVIFRSSTGDSRRLSKQIAAAVAQRHGFAPQVIVLTCAELRKAAAANPFPEAEANPKSVHLFFLVDPPNRPDLQALETLKANGERFVLKGRLFYLYTPAGFGGSKLAARVERFLGVEATARNWRTITSLLQLAGD